MKRKKKTKLCRIFVLSLWLYHHLDCTMCSPRSHYPRANFLLSTIFIGALFFYHRITVYILRRITILLLFYFSTVQLNEKTFFGAEMSSSNECSDENVNALCICVSLFVCHNVTVYIEMVGKRRENPYSDEEDMYLFTRTLIIDACFTRYKLLRSNLCLTCYQAQSHRIAY